jgi:hypothetical protein
MNKKLLTSLAPVLAIAAFAVMPAAAQAMGPYWYKNNQKMPAGQQATVLTWGTWTIQTPVGVGTCKVSDAEVIENPLNGGPGVDHFIQLSFYSCSSPQCPFILTVTPNFPWTTELFIHPGIWEHIFNFSLTAVCTPPSGPPFSYTATGLSLNVSKPNGTSASKPSYLEFLGAESGELESEIGPVTIVGKDKMMGFEEQELITAKES